MMSVGLSPEDAEPFLARVDKPSELGLTIACYNSPKNVTISGDEAMIDELKVLLDEAGHFARKLQVNVAYHSKQMEAIATEYRASIGELSPRAAGDAAPIPMVSSVTGGLAARKSLLQPDYWVQNLVSPVRFTQAVLHMCSQGEAGLAKKIDHSHLYACVVDHLLEVGPHSALQGPIRDILKKSPRGTSVNYTSMLVRNNPADVTTLSMAGQLYCSGYPVNLSAVNAPAGSDTQQRLKMLVDLPEYPFDHSRGYWHESRISKNYRFRKAPPLELLGSPDPDWNPLEAKWRHVIRHLEIPWVEDHKVSILSKIGLSSQAYSTRSMVLSFTQELVW
jgi:acyl transferase domain-containing protein